MAGPRLEARLVASPALPEPVRVVVQLPPSYDEAPARRYPVLYFLHDGFGDEERLADRGIAARLDAEMAAGRLPEMLVVSPRGVGTWFTDSYDGKVRYGAFLDVRRSSRSSTAPSGRSRAARPAPPPGSRWGATAPSAGASARRSSSPSPAASPRPSSSSRAAPLENLPFFVRPAFRRVFGEGAASGAFRRHDLASILLDDPGLAARAPELLLRCGTEDKYLLSDVASFFHKLVTALGGRSELVLEPGGHDWAYWRSAFVPFAADVARRLDRAEEAAVSGPRLVLFDVDGTLLSSGRRGLDAFSEALRRTFGTDGDIASYRFEGKLDPVIVADLMRGAGIPDDVVAERRPAALSLYLDLLEEALAAEPPRSSRASPTSSAASRPPPRPSPRS